MSRRVHEARKNTVSASRLLCCSFVLVTCLSGCMNPYNTRFPTLWTAHPQSELQAFQQQDPFPDPDMAPGTESRPRAFIRPRNEARRAAEQRILQGLPSSPEMIPPGAPQGGLSRPAAVY